MANSLHFYGLTISYFLSKASMIFLEIPGSRELTTSQNLSINEEFYLSDFMMSCWRYSVLVLAFSLEIRAVILFLIASLSLTGFMLSSSRHPSTWLLGSLSSNSLRPRFFSSFIAISSSIFSCDFRGLPLPLGFWISTCSV